MNQNLQHIHILIKGYATTFSPLIQTQMELNKWTRDLVHSQGMRIVIEPRCHYVADEGNEGFTGSCNIATSHFAYHIWDKQGIVQLDFYTCGCLDIPDLFYNLTKLGIDKVDYIVFNRENGFEIIESKKGLEI